MKRLSVLVACAVVLGGCSMFRPKPIEVAPAPVVKLAPPQLLDANGAPIEVIPFKAGMSSATVERLAKAQACSGGAGAGLVTQPGPVEVYRMQCDNGKVFMARCELRQCKAM
ncbi:MAG TPA: hypothetical protein VFG03_23260 [Telluria sp.]|nr:hypothetical protein [Telluria sp.]